MTQEIPYIQLAVIIVVGIAFIRVAPTLLKLAVRTSLILSIVLMVGLWFLFQYILG